MVNEAVQDNYTENYLIEDLLIDVSLRKKLAFEISIEEFRKKVIVTLNRLCLYSDDGYDKSIEILDFFTVLNKTGSRFKIIIDTLNLLLLSSEKIPSNNNNNYYYKQLAASDREQYILELLVFVNNLIKSGKSLKDRCFNRQQMISLKLLEIFRSLNNLYPNNKLINSEIGYFISQRKSEEYEYSVADIDLNSHIDVYHALYSQVQGTVNEKLLISLLRHLLKIDKSSKLGNYIWEVAEKLVCRAALFDKDDRKLSDALERYTDEKFKSLQNLTSHETNPQNQEVAPVKPPMPPPPPPPPFSELILLKKKSNANVSTKDKSPIDNNSAEAIQQSQSKSSKLSLENRSLKLSMLDDPEATKLQKLPQQVVPKAQVKMKQLIWSKIQSNRIMGNQSIWTKGSNVTCREEAFFNKIEEFFKTSENPRAESQTKEPTLNISAKNWHYNSMEKINLLENKRSLNVNIYLKQFRCSPDEILELLAKNDESLGMENLEGMLKILPDANEIELLKVYQGDIDKLGEAEKFLFKLIHVRNYKLRIESLILKEEFSGLMTYFNKTYESFFKAAKVVYNSVNLADILVLICRTGNFINEGNFSGNAAGFKLSSLIKLSDLKSNKQNISLLHVISQQLEETNSHLIELPKELEPLREISDIQLDNFKNETTNFCVRVNKLSQQIESTEETQNLIKLKSFITESQIAIRQLETKEKMLVSWKSRLAEHFCEDTALFKLEDCFNILVKFSDKLKKCIQDNEARRCTELRRSSSVRFPRKYTNHGQIYARTSVIGFEHFGTSNEALPATSVTSHVNDELPKENPDDLDDYATNGNFFRRSSFRMSRKSTGNKRIETLNRFDEQTRELPDCRSSFKDFHKINESLLKIGNLSGEDSTINLASSKNDDTVIGKLTRRSLSTSEFDLGLNYFEPERTNETLKEEEECSHLSSISRNHSKSSSRLSGLKKLGNLYKTFEEDDSLFSRNSIRNNNSINAEEENEDCDSDDFKKLSTLNAKRALFETASRQIQTDAFSRNSIFRHTIHQSSSNIVGSRINKFETRSELKNKYLGADDPVLKTSNNKSNPDSDESSGLNLKRINSVKINSITNQDSINSSDVSLVSKNINDKGEQSKSLNKKWEPKPKEISINNSNTVDQSTINKPYTGHRHINIVEKIEKFNSNNLIQIVSSKQNDRCASSLRLAEKKTRLNSGCTTNSDDNEASLKDDGFETQSNSSSCQTSETKIEMSPSVEDEISRSDSHKLVAYIAYTNSCMNSESGSIETKADNCLNVSVENKECNLKINSMEKTSRISKSLKQIKQSKTSLMSSSGSSGFVSKNKTFFRPVATITASAATTLQKNKNFQGSNQSLESIKKIQITKERTMSNSNLCSLSLVKNNSSVTNSNLSLNESSRKQLGSSFYLNDTASTKAKKNEIKQLVNTNKEPLNSTLNDSVSRKKSVLCSASTICLPTNPKEAQTKVAKQCPKRNSSSVFDRLTRSSKNFKEMRPTVIIN